MCSEIGWSPNPAGPGLRREESEMDKNTGGPRLQRSGPTPHAYPPHPYLCRVMSSRLHPSGVSSGESPGKTNRNRASPRCNRANLLAFASGIQRAGEGSIDAFTRPCPRSPPRSAQVHPATHKAERSRTSARLEPCASHPFIFHPEFLNEITGRCPIRMQALMATKEPRRPF